MYVDSFQWKFIFSCNKKVKSCFHGNLLVIQHPVTTTNFITINVDYGNAVSSIEIVLDVNQLNIFDLGYQVETEPRPPCQLVRKYQACKL